MAIPLYGQNKDGDALGALSKNVGYKEIVTITAGHASHTLSEEEGGIILVSAAMASGAVIQLPLATVHNIGLQYRIVFGGTMAAAMTITGARVFKKPTYWRFTSDHRNPSSSFTINISMRDDLNRSFPNIMPPTIAIVKQTAA